MAKKFSSSKLDLPNAILDVRSQLSTVRYQSGQYQKLILQWRFLCRLLIGAKLYLSMEPTVAKSWFDLYSKCPSGTPEEVIAHGAWQASLDQDVCVPSYRKRAIAEAKRACILVNLRATPFL